MLSAASPTSPKNFPAESATPFSRRLNLRISGAPLPPPAPFAKEFLARDWPLLRECCSLPRLSANITELLSKHAPSDSFPRLAEEHGVVAQVVSALDTLAGPLLQQDSPRQTLSTHLQSLRNALKVQTVSTLALSAELFRILDLLQGANLHPAVIKGPSLALRAYGDAAARHYRDIDLLLRHSEIAQASQILSSSGFHADVSPAALQAGKTPGQYLFRRPQSAAVIELHTERTLRYFPRPLPIEDFFRRQATLSLDGRRLPVLSAEDEFVLISIHGAKHFWERLMWISDVAAIVHRHPELDWPGVRQSAAAVGAERMVRIALQLAERVLRVPVPAEMKREVAADSACLPMITKIESWLPYSGYDPPPLAQRALFRLRMRGHLLAGARYLTRLSFSTTEEDWSRDPQSPAASFTETLRRPFRLARKYRRSKDQ